MIFFDNIVKRVANFSVQSHNENRNNRVDFFKNNQLFRLSILISSRSLYEDVNKSKDTKVKKSLSKYFIRAHFNPTPFGVFNSVGVLNWGSSTSIKKQEALALSVKYDSLFLSGHIHSDSAADWLNKSYCLNPSIHFLNSTRISFYKSDVEKGDKVELKYVEIDYDDNLEWVVNRFKKAVLLEEILNEIILDGFQRDEVEHYLKNIIDCGLIIECFLFSPYAEKLSKPNFYLPSDLIKKDFHLLHNTSEINDFSKQYLLEQDAFFKSNNSGVKYSHAVNSFDRELGTLDFHFKEKIKRYIDFAIQYNSHSTHRNDLLNKFSSKISERYNDGFIAMSKIFNPYSGLDYTSLATQYELKLDRKVLGKILAETENNIYMDLPIDPNIGKKTTKLPASFSIMAEILVCKKTNKEILYIKSLGSTSALNLVARFSDITNDLCQEIVSFEKEINEGKIVADINCIGTFRSINVSAKKQFYDFSIPINTSVNEVNSILMSDIFLHLNGGEMRLVSKKYKKQILPKITSSLNPNLSDSEVYKFLYDFEFYNQEIYGINFDFNSYSYFKPFVPRIYLEKDVLLYPAQLLLVDRDYTFEEFKIYFSENIKDYKFSTLINLSEGSGQLVLDTENEDDIKIIFEKVKEKNFIYIAESLYDSFYPEIRDKADSNYAHELVISVKNNEYFRSDISYESIEELSNCDQTIPIVSDWLYLELFTNSYSSKDILKYVSNNILINKEIYLFFFVNYHNPDRCIRLRFKTNSQKCKEDIINKIHHLKNINLISNYHIKLYDQEIQRYGGIKLMELAETIFSLDSKNAIMMLTEGELSDEDVKIGAILKIKSYLELFDFSIDEMIEYCEQSIKFFENEFDLTADLRKSLNKDFLNLKSQINNFAFNSYLCSDCIKRNIETELEIKKSYRQRYVSILIHMSMNRHFEDNHRFNEFKTYYLAKAYLNQIKFTKNA